MTFDPTRALAIVAGILILAAVAHATIFFTTGYGTPHAYLTITVAMGVAVASVVCARASTRPLAMFLVVCIASGEAYNFLQSANRLIASSEAAQAPKREYAKAFARARAEVEAAQVIVDAPQTSQRLRDAQHARELADQTVRVKSADKGCREYCAKMLQSAVTEAVEEVSKAQAAIESDHRAAQTALGTARAKADGMNAPESPNPLADRLGVASWKIDVLIAALGSIAINGLACGLMIFGAHSGKKSAPTQVIGRMSPPVVPLRLAPAGDALDFLHDGMEIIEGGRTEMADACIAYQDWCRARSLRPAPEFAGMMEKLCKQFRIPVVTEGGRRYLVNVRVRESKPKRRNAT